MEHVMEPDNGDDLDPPQDAEIVQPREPWDKKVDESQRAYLAFSMFRDSEKRSLKGVADSLNCSVQNVFWWSTRHNWRLRCDSYDLHVDQQQRQDFARHHVRMRDRHLAVAQAMLGVAAHGLKEWQSVIAAGGALHLQPEQVAMLVKCASELERSTLGIDDEGHRPPVINVIIGSHRYDGEKAGDSGIEDEAEVLMSWQDAERIEYERLSPSEKAALDTWKTPPTKPRLN